MAKIGLKYPVAAEILTENQSGAPTYDTGFSLGYAVEANVSVENSEQELYADDQLVESDTSFAGGTIDMNVDHLSEAIYATLLGHEVTTENGVSIVVAKTTDTAPYFGVGYVRVLKKSGIRKYRAVWLYKVRFSEPTDEGATKGKTVEFATEAISGSIYELPDGGWKDRGTFDSETDAKAWIDNRAGTVGVVSKTNLAADISTANALAPATYTSASYAVVYFRLQEATAVNLNADATQAQVDLAEDNLEAALAALVTL